MTEAPTTNGQALVPYVGGSALHVDEAQLKETAATIVAHKGGLFPADMTAPQAGALARLALAYNLDPFASELILYQGKPYLTIDGRLRLANQHPQFDGIECNPATPDERRAFRCRDDEHLWVARVWRRDRRIPTVGFGRSSGNDSNPLSKTWGQEMAQKRAKHRALRDAFSLPLPGYEEEAGDAPPRYSSGDVVEGEVIDASEAISAGQVTAIHAVLSACKIPDEAYRAVLQTQYGVASSTELTAGQGTSLIEALVAWGEAGPPVEQGQTERPKHREKPISEEQVVELVGLIHELVVAEAGADVLSPDELLDRAKAIPGRYYGEFAVPLERLSDNDARLLIATVQQDLQAAKNRAKGIVAPTGSAALAQASLDAE